jgi:AraC-like DNA-binding protein
MPSPEFRQARSAGTPVFTSGVNETVLIAGHFEFDYLPLHPFLEQLPPVIHIKQYGTENQLLLQQISQWMLKELNDTLPGGSLMLKSLSEILFVNIIRAYLEQAPPDSGFLAALNDPRISRALQLIHDSPENDWTLDSLASAVAMSRSVFFNQFKRLVQETPLNYLTDWRIRKAQAMLTTATGSVADVAAFVGYQSESAFNRVFKTRTGETPAAYRRSRAVR